MISWRRLSVAGLATLLAQLACDSQNTDPGVIPFDEDEVPVVATGGQVSGSGGAPSAGGSDPQGTGGQAPPDPNINPETGLHNIWQVAYRLQVADHVHMLNLGSLVVQRHREDIEDPEGPIYDIYLIDPAEQTGTLIASQVRSTWLFGEDYEWLYFRHYDGRNSQVARALKQAPEVPGMGGASPVLEEPEWSIFIDWITEEDSFIGFRGFLGDRVYFTRGDYNLLDPEGWEWLVGVSSETGEEFLNMETEGHGAVVLPAIREADIVYLFAGSYQVMRVTAGAEAPVVEFDLPSSCASFIRNATYDGWLALCDTGEQMDLVAFDGYGNQTVVLPQVPVMSLRNIFGAPGYLFSTANNDGFTAFHLETNELVEAFLNDMQLLGFREGRAYVKVNDMILSATIEEIAALSTTQL